MKKLADILKNIELELIGNDSQVIKRIVFDSRVATKNDLFAALVGTAHDGHQYITDVVKNGCKCILCEKVPDSLPENVTVIKVTDSHTALGQIASNFYDSPSSKFKLVGITGTNGKTSIATLLHRLFTQLGFKAGLLSTVRNLIGEEQVDATHTTPDSVSLNYLMGEMAKAGCDYVFMEVSSHAIDQNRIAGLDFDGGVFTNITHDHLDYHKTFDEYIKAKKLFFDKLPKDAFALINTDDKHAKVMVQNTQAKVNTYSLHHISDFKAKLIESHFDGTMLTINKTEVWTQLIGQFNSSNLLAVYGVAILLGQNHHEILKELSSLKTVDGRFEYLQSNTGVTAIIDYAHTPDALLNVLSTINTIRQGKGQLISVVGAGGNRDKTKRPEMAQIASEASDKLILTSDNPRNEDPQSIIDDMLKGVETHRRQRVISIVDRREAIRTACMMAKSGDIILVAGKGHETYQEVRGIKTHFNDKEVVAEFFLLNQINNQ
jgi:UDP-N-acetylmuramoyl-L-alanyl-D-glutamate--2,6-diaminopimelate ligase